jgi:hypothetical protein
MIAQLNDAELFYEVAGAGPPLVCVHGLWDDPSQLGRCGGTAS